MNLHPIVLEHGERFGKLTVLRRYKTKKNKWVYKCGCECGTQGTKLRASQLMKGSVTACRKCVAISRSAKSHHRIS